ncbi:glycerol-3-phosphate dehydrogenase/oxidase [Tropicimonas marinistellae]|uniref:glycerol-3-phosphate dehydrogenase/oxidase n=1 Tax=Tropicimonas marinistellae TaxID=1739787 RepID=UPI0008313926|nr:glycerol-3-phosphate dehydrogenase/oxidase [Tropicimonas marinistellae]
MTDTLQIVPPEARAARLARLDGSHPQVLVIGGGINGASVYRELALNGVEVALVDKADFCAGASSALSRMVHGGLRYLENGEFDLVREALDERNRLLANAPHQVRPLRTVMPIDSWFSGTLNAPLKFLGLTRAPSRRGALPVRLGLWFYDIYTRGRGGMPRSRFLMRKAAMSRFPAFPARTRCAAAYFDGQVSHPERVVTEIFEDVARAGCDATTINYLAVTSIGPDGVILQDRIAGKALTCKPDIVINATGAWLDLTNGHLSPPPRENLVEGTKGSHLMVDHPELREILGEDMVYYENLDGRICILFVLHGMVLIGSTDLKVPDPDGIRCEEEERAYILEGLRTVFPGITIRENQVRFIFSGVRPLPVSAAGTTGQIPRGHYTHWLNPSKQDDHAPILCMIGGKWTTFRAFGELAADETLARLGRTRSIATDDLAIGGGKSFPESPADWIARVSARSGLPDDRVATLLARYGTLAEALAQTFAGEQPLASPPGYSDKEIDYLVAHEQVETLEDLVLRRSVIALAGQVDAQTLATLADRLATAKGWNDADRTACLTAFQQKLVADHGLTPERVGLATCNREVAAE